MKWRIWEYKCLLLLRIQSLDEGSLARIIYQEAEEKGWPGLGRDVRDICQEIQIPDLNKYRMAKKEIQRAIEQSHHDDIMTQFQHSKKLEDIRNSDFSHFQEYFNDRDLETSRMKFKIRSKMLDKIPGNFKNRYKNIQNCLKCLFCDEDMTQNHCLLCPGRQEHRKNLDMTNLDDLVIYFNAILGD